ncbi:RluA family pseudouridine synthase [Bdellovibrionota bacterium FG-1]
MLHVEVCNQRADLLILSELRKTLPELSRTRLKEFFRAQKIRIQGQPLDPARLMNAGVYEVQIEDLPLEPEIAKASSQGSFLPIIYEDDEMLVLNKRTGIPSLPHSPDETETAVGAALAHFPGLAQIGPRPLEPGLLHRLDTGTSGLLAFAKTPAAFLRLKEAWKEGKVQKTYRTLVRPESPPLHLPLTLQLTLAHDVKNKRKMRVIETKTSPHSFRGKPLPTLTHLIRKHTAPNEFHDLEIEIETGVMHQIRCSLAHLGLPIVGDSTYGGPPSERLWLHAWRLEIPKTNGALLKLEAELPW